jgi:hypothetical protein
LLNAGVYGEDDDTSGMSASVILGKVPEVGTGMCELLYKCDTNQYAQNV